MNLCKRPTPHLMWKMRRLFDCVALSTSGTCCIKVKKWTSGKDVRPAAADDKNKARTIKRRNWEVAQTFGPLLATAAERRRSTYDDESKTLGKLMKSGKKVTIHVKEAGYKHIDAFVPATDRSSIAEIEESAAGRGLHLQEPYFSEGDHFRMAAQSSPWRKITTAKVVESNTTGSLKKNTTRSVAARVHQGAARTLSVIRDDGSLSAFPMTRTANADLLAQKCRAELELHPAFLGRPSVSSILQKTMPVESARALEIWKAKMVAQLGIEGFQKYQADMFQVGQTLHRWIEEYLSRKSFEELRAEDSIAGYWRSMQGVLGDISDVFLLETGVDHPFLLYRGVLDCVAKYKGRPTLIEWKTSQRLKSSLQDIFDNPLQAAAYLGALNFTNHLDFQVTRAAIVVAYSSGVPAHVHVLDEDLCKHYWNLWLRRLREFSSADEPV